MNRIVVGILAVLILTGCSEATTTDKTPTPRPGNQEVYQRIESLTDCQALQREFDLADENGKRDRARGEVELAKITTLYMQAADKRMKEIGCTT